MAEMVKATEHVWPWEPCLSLSEVNRVLPVAGAGLRRIQAIRVVRNDEPWEWVSDMGPAARFKAEPFVFQGAVQLSDGRVDVLETVERLRAAADEYRAEYAKPPERPEAPAFTLLFEEYATRRREARRNVKRFAVQGKELP